MVPPGVLSLCSEWGGQPGLLPASGSATAAPRARQQECFQEGKPWLKQKLDTSHFHTPGQDLRSSVGLVTRVSSVENNLLEILVQKH